MRKLVIPAALLLLAGAGCFSGSPATTGVPSITQPSAASRPTTIPSGPGGSQALTPGTLPTPADQKPLPAATSTPLPDPITTEPATTTVQVIGPNPGALMAPNGFTTEYRLIVHNDTISELTTTVKKGTVVSWTNYDLHDHEFVADNGSFDIGPLEIRVPFFLDTSILKPGSYPYHGVDLPSLHGTLIVQ